MFNRLTRTSLDLRQQKDRLRKLIRRAINRRRLPFFQRLLREDKAWALYVLVVQRHIKACKNQKLATNYGRASSEQKKLLEQMDIEIETMENMIEIPERMIRAALVQEHERAEEELRGETRDQVAAEQKKSESLI